MSALGALVPAGTVAAGAEARPFELGVTDPAFGSVEAGTRKLKEFSKALARRYSGSVILPAGPPA